MAIHIGKGENECQLHIDGRFTFETYREFLSAVDGRSPHCKHLTIDLTRTDYLDSSALGLLIQMRQRLSNPERNVLRVKKGSVAEEVLTITNFAQMFQIEVT
ncbi:MAG: STAS domain-containing protein [Gammaproteobacteria bacterium]|nr:STAS domain-containing protein [Gammaproteobacteria bacterium]